MDEAQQSYLNLLKKTFEKRQEFVRYDVNLFNEYQNKLTVHSTAISRNCELLVCGCSKSIIVLYDLLSKKSYKGTNPKKLQFRKHQIVTISFSNCYDYIIAGNTLGDLLIYQITIDIQNQAFMIELMRFIPSYHDKAIQTIYHSSIDHLLTISSERLRVAMISDFIINENITESINKINMPLNGVTASKIMFYDQHYYLYIGFRDNSIIKIKSSHLFTKQNKNEEKIHQINSTSSVINKLEASNDQTLLAIAYQSGQQESGNLLLLYLKKGKQIYQKNAITKLKISEMVFFQDNSHLCIGSWDGSFQLLNIAKKELLAHYTHTMHSIGVIAFFPITEASQFPTLISVGQDHIIKKYYFGTIRDQLFDYIPFIFWVEQRIRQELQFQSELHTYQKMLYVESMGVDSVKMRELNQSVFGFETFSPLWKRVIDYKEYADRSSVLFKRYEAEKLQRSTLLKSNKLPPLEAHPKLPQIEGSITGGASMKNSVNNQDPFAENFNILDEHYIFTFSRISQTIDYGKIKMMVLQKCHYIFEEKLPFKVLMFEMLQKMKKLKYLDLSFNSLSLDDVLEILDQLKGVTTLDFLSLAHNRLGEGATRISNSDAIMRLMDEVVAISLRSNKLSDLDGEAILNQIKHFKKLNILDISGNLDFKDKTLQALQRITILQNKIEFSAQRVDYMGFLNKIKFIQEKEIQEELLEQQQLLEPDKQSNINEDHKLIENPPEPEPEAQTIDRQLSISSAGTYMSLQLLCIQFQKEVCEQAMKTATDFLVQRKITNLYIYVVDNKEDDVWETSISIFYTRNLKKLNDYIYGCIGGFFFAFFSCFVNLHKTIRHDGYYCIKRMFCTNYFLWKYVACAFCTFLTTRLGKFIVLLFGVESSYYEFNQKILLLENKLKEQRFLMFFLFALYFVCYYFVVVFLPLIFVNECQGQQWTGHLIYLAFAGYSFMVEGYLGLTISNLQVTTNEYTDGSTTARYFYIIKDLLISQLTKFELYTCVCFIVLINSCNVQTIIAWIGVALIGINLLFDLALIVRYLLVPYIYKQKLTYIDVYTQFSTLYQMNIVTNLLEKWSEQNTMYVFFLSTEVPQKVVVSIIKTFFQDIPLLLLQAIYLGLNQNQIQIQILVVSLIIVVIHCIFSIIKMLSITRAAKINEEIMLQEIKKSQNDNKTFTLLKELKRFLRRFKRRITEIINQNNEKNENVILSLVDTERALLNRPHTLHDLDQYEKQRSAKIMPARKGITQIGNKVQRVNISKNSKVSAEELFKKISVKSSLDIFGQKVKSWKLENDIPIDITDTLLSDVPRQLFAIDLDWESQQPWVGNIKISSLNQEIEGFKMAYQFFKDKQELDILDLGYGSGYVSLVLLALALRRNQNMKITLHLVDHHQDTAKHFANKLANDFAQFSNRCKFIYYVHDCLSGFSIFLNQQFDYIHLGFGVTKWRLNKQIIPLLKEDGKLFGYEIESTLQQKQFTYNQLDKNFNYSKSFETYGIMEPLTIQLKDMAQFYNDDAIVKPEITTYIKLWNECALCSKSLNSQEKQFINHYWGECICYACGNLELEQQGEEIDIAKIKYKSNVIYYSGGNCKLNQIKQTSYLLENLTYPFGHKSGTLREYQVACSSCNSKRGFGFQYRCLVCSAAVYCNSCGLLLMNDNTMKFHTTCSPDHPLLRIMFPSKAKGKK